jgi:hypothetical protein
MRAGDAPALGRAGAADHNNSVLSVSAQSTTSFGAAVHIRKHNRAFVGHGFQNEGWKPTNWLFIRAARMGAFLMAT